MFLMVETLVKREPYSKEYLTLSIALRKSIRNHLHLVLQGPQGSQGIPIATAVVNQECHERFGENPLGLSFQEAIRDFLEESDKR